MASVTSLSENHAPSLKRKRESGFDDDDSQPRPRHSFFSDAENERLLEKARKNNDILRCPCQSRASTPDDKYVVVDEEIGRKFAAAYEASEVRAQRRLDDYGPIAAEYRPGLTPQEVRDEFVRRQTEAERAMVYDSTDEEDARPSISKLLEFIKPELQATQPIHGPSPQTNSQGASSDYSSPADRQGSSNDMKKYLGSQIWTMLSSEVEGLREGLPPPSDEEEDGEDDDNEQSQDQAENRSELPSGRTPRAKRQPKSYLEQSRCHMKIQKTSGRRKLQSLRRARETSSSTRAGRSVMVS